MLGASFVTSSLHERSRELEIKVEVSCLLGDLVSDVEAWWSEVELQKSRRELLVSVSLLQKLSLRVKTLEADKTRLLEQLSEVRERAVDVRDKFAVDISKVLTESRRVEKMKKALKEAEVALKEERKANTLLAASSGGALTTAIGARGAPAVVAIAAQAAGAEAANTVDASSSSSSSSSSFSSSPATANNSSLAVPAPEPSEAVVSEAATLSSPLPPSPSSSSSSRPRQRKCLLSDVADLLLLNIFSFLQTGEVLGTAQANRFIFQRVDGLFGIDSKLPQLSWGERFPSVLGNEDGGGEEGGGGAADPSSSSSSASPASVANDGKSIAASSAGGGGVGGVGMWLGNRLQDVVAKAGAALQNLGPASASDASNVVLSKEALEAMSKKLSGSEYRQVVAVNELAKKLVVEAERLAREKEEQIARCTSTETVRDFLVTKLRSAEIALKTALHECIQLKKQASADGEVISYLDIRGQELEGQTQELENIKNHLTASLALHTHTHTHTHAEMAKEVREWKGKWEEGESSFKAQKKVLVKEVKALRQSLEMVSAERNVYASQIKAMKETLGVSFGGGGGGGGAGWGGGGLSGGNGLGGKRVGSAGIGRGAR